METYGKTPTVGKKLKDEVVRLTKSRWDYVTDEIRPLTEHSRRAWECYLDSTVSPEVLAEADVEETFVKKPRMGLIPKTVNTLLSIQHNSSFPDESNFFSATPLNQKAFDLQAFYEEAINQRFKEKATLQRLRMLRLCSILDGTACLYVKHTHDVQTRINYQEETQQVIDPMQGPVEVPTGGVLEFETEEVTYDGAEVEIVPFSDWRVEPFANNLDEAYFLRRMWVDTYKAKEMFPNAPKQLFVPLQTRYTEDYKANYQSLFTFSDAVSSKDSDKDMKDAKKKCLLTFHYDDFVVDGKVYENHLAVVVNNLEVVWFGKNPYNHGKKPYLITPYTEIPNQMYGVSAVYHLIPASEIMDSGFSIMNENAKWLSSPIFLGDMTDPMLAQQKEIKVQPETVIPVTRKDAFTQLPINMGNITFMKDVMGMAQEMSKEVSGATDYMTGAMPDKTHISATDTSLRVDNGGSRFQTILDTFNRNVTQPLMQMSYENDRQYKVKDEFVSGYIITPEDIKLSNFVFDTVSAAAAVSKARTAQQKMQLLSEILPMLMQMGVVAPKQQLVEADIAKLLESYLLDVDMLDVESFVQSRDYTPEEIMQIQMQQMMQAQTEEVDNA